MPIIYAKRKVMLIATPSYILPQNLVTVPLVQICRNRASMFYTTDGKVHILELENKEKRMGLFSSIFLLFSFELLALIM